MITDYFKLLSSSAAKKGAWLIIISSAIYWILNTYFNIGTSVYKDELLLAFIIAISYQLYYYGGKLLDWRQNRNRNLVILKATYGASKTPKDVTKIVRDLVKNESLNFIVDDDIFLQKGKVDDDMPGSKKTLSIKYEFSAYYSQREPVKLGVS